MDPTASIIVPTRARAGYLDVALASIAPQAAAAGAEMLVVDDGPSSATQEVARRHGARYVAHPSSRGLNAARNTGIEAAAGALLVFVDDDVAVRPGWLAALLAADATAAPEVGVLTGPIHARFEDHALRSCGREGPPITSQDHGAVDRDVAHAWGANMTVRRHGLELAGRFDESRELYGDEQEWQQRLRAAGGRIRYVAAAALDHRRAGDDARLRSLCGAAFRRGEASRRFDVFKGAAPSLPRELRVLAGCAIHPVRYRCPNGVVLAAHSLGRVRAAIAGAAAGKATGAGADDAGEGRAGVVGAGGAGTGGAGRASAGGISLASAGGAGRATAGGKSLASAGGAGRATAGGNSLASASGAGRATAGGKSLASAGGAGRVGAGGAGRVGAGGAGRVGAGGAGRVGAGGAGRVGAGEEPDFLSDESGTVRGLRRPLMRAVDLLLDAEAARRTRGLDRGARMQPPRRRVLVLGIERPGRLMTAARIELHRTRHEVAMHTIAMGEGGKFEHLNALLAAHPPDGFDWLLVVDDDVVLPRRFLDRFLHCAEDADLVLAQPAHRRHSHAAWRVTHRRPGGAVRASHFAEIGPVTAFAAEAFETLLPFPDLRMGWGLDAHWAALARERGWPVGIVDATPILHTTPVGGGYARADAVAEATVFLAERPYVTRAEARWSRRVR